jgi:hypothetical protein
MKKLLLLWPAIIIAALLFTSCSTTITKRHYRKGFFVQHHKHPAKTDIRQNEVLPEQIARVEIPEIKSEAKGEERGELVFPKTSQPKAVKEADKGGAVAAAKTKSSPRDKVMRVARLADKLTPGNVITQRIPTASAEKVGPEGGLIAATLSLFWIVLVVLLILYIIGILTEGFGLGPIIHLLGVIFLVMLILWLLGVV